MATGIAETTLRRWARNERRQGRGARERLPGLRAQLTEFRGQLTTREPAENARAQLQERVLASLVEDAIRLSESLEEVIGEASLGQRAAALNQVLDKLLKVLALLPRQEETLVQVEFIDSQGAAHTTPPWAEEDPGE